MTITVGIVVVSHSAKVAQGVVEMAAQMGPHVVLKAAGGTDDGAIGTSFTRIEAAVHDALSQLGPGGAVVVVPDLGSSTMNAESVVEALDEADRAVVVDAPIVEGAVACAATAELGGTLAEVVASAHEQGRRFSHGSAQNTTIPTSNGSLVELVGDTPVIHAQQSQESDTVTRVARVNDPVGLHARPAAQLARLAGTFDAGITVNGADAKSVLELMALGVGQGQHVTIAADGADAGQAVDALVAMLEDLDTAAAHSAVTSRADM